MNYKILKWDSIFFGFKVAYINFTKKDTDKLDYLLARLKQKGVTLVYVSSIIDIDDEEYLLTKYSGIIVDIKITYTKNIDRYLNNRDDIINYDSESPTDQMINLAIESGIYSRFNVDKRIGRDKYEELYKLWIKNSVNHRIAKKVLVYKKENDDILGMITLSEKNGIANIGLIAVDINMRGNGIGKSLVKAAEKWAFENYFNEIQVVTQRVNVPAIRLYEKNGFLIDNIEYYYHFWLK